MWNIWYYQFKEPKNRTHPTTFWSLPTKNSQCPNIYRPERLIMRKIAKISILNSFLFAIPFMTGINFLIFIFFLRMHCIKMPAVLLITSHHMIFKFFFVHKKLKFLFLRYMNEKRMTEGKKKKLDESKLKSRKSSQWSTFN